MHGWQCPSSCQRRRTFARKSSELLRANPPNSLSLLAFHFCAPRGFSTGHQRQQMPDSVRTSLRTWAVRTNQKAMVPVVTPLGNRPFGNQSKTAVSVETPWKHPAPKVRSCCYRGCYGASANAVFRVYRAVYPGPRMPDSMDTGWIPGWIPPHQSRKKFPLLRFVRGCLGSAPGPARQLPVKAVPLIPGGQSKKSSR